MAYIDKDKALNLDFKINVSMFESRRKTAERAVQAYADAISRIPAADVRPVVLCRDCKNNYNTCLNHGINEPMCDFTDRKLRGDDFCSRGEKREES